jgi:type III secretion system FlhB-like substrate exporter
MHNVKRKKSFLTLNNVEVCLSTYCEILSVSATLVKCARAEATKKLKISLDCGATAEDSALDSAEALNGSVERLNAVAFVLNYVNASGAELLPFGSDLKRATEFQQRMPGDGESLDELSIVRLLEGTGATLHSRYLLKSNDGLNYPTLELTAFMDVFQNDSRLMHIQTARKRASFSLCDECAEYKAFCFNHYAAPDLISARKAQQAQHILLVAAERMVATSAAQATVVDRQRGAEQIPPVIYITINVVISFDKMTHHSCLVPQIYPPPKCLNVVDRLPYSLTGVVVAGVAYLTFLSTSAQSGGCNLTIEILLII